MTAAPKKVNLALQGGGAHGAVAWGVLDRLLEDERIAVEGISGASAGAVNAAALAYGLFRDGRAGARETLDQLWAEIARVGAFYSPVRALPFDNADNPFSYRMFDIFTRVCSPYEFNPFNINPLRDVLTRVIDFDKLSKCTKTRLFLSATNVRTGKIKIFRTKDASIDAVLASTCLPFLFKAVEIDGEAYWDGGYMGNPPLFPFIYEVETCDILIVHVNPLTREEVPVSASGILNRINEISFNSSLLREFRAIAFVEKLLEDGWIKEEHQGRLKHIRVHSVRSDRPLTEYSVASKFNVDPEFLNALKAHGRSIADDWISENFDSIGVRSSANIRDMFDGGS
ncbi:MAG TPA: alpha/beta hydrolase [Parvularcula sp.]|nr:alpha/beta hydrolase [Parvularcula sp.]HBS32118.1 alpha/beta hydrolase [Parvularcula sp.]HBS33711.1 alpha/beta hydrolase [Parvularcula sp.]